ncbi:MAG TPA: PCRF domain-containing protein, partial [Gammaproteobacteria bacterium]|nr:PCRF domain-containing protein [Gammaproteobacteria bacterium]
MTPELIVKLEKATERHEEIAHLLSDPDVMSDQNQFRELSKEYASLEDLVVTFAKLKQAESDIKESQEMMSDPEMAELAKETLEEAKDNFTELGKQLRILLIPKDPDDDK